MFSTTLILTTHKMPKEQNHYLICGLKIQLERSQRTSTTLARTSKQHSLERWLLVGNSSESALTHTRETFWQGTVRLLRLLRTIIVKSTRMVTLAPIKSSFSTGRGIAPSLRLKMVV